MGPPTLRAGSCGAAVGTGALEATAQFHRAALLPDAAVVAEIGGSWRVVPTPAVLGAWAVVGLALAPGLLRRMARRESGGDLQERRDQAMLRSA